MQRPRIRRGGDEQIAHSPFDRDRDGAHPPAVQRVGGFGAAFARLPRLQGGGRPRLPGRDQLASVSSAGRRRRGRLPSPPIRRRSPCRRESVGAAAAWWRAAGRCVTAGGCVGADQWAGRGTDVDAGVRADVRENAVSGSVGRSRPGGLLRQAPEAVSSPRGGCASVERRGGLQQSRRRISSRSRRVSGTPSRVRTGFRSDSRARQQRIGARAVAAGEIGTTATAAGAPATDGVGAPERGSGEAGVGADAAVDVDVAFPVAEQGAALFEVDQVPFRRCWLAIFLTPRASSSKRRGTAATGVVAVVTERSGSRGSEPAPASPVVGIRATQPRPEPASDQWVKSSIRTVPRSSVGSRRARRCGTDAAPESLVEIVGRGARWVKSSRERSPIPSG